MALQEKEIVLITGANAGLGLEIARALIRDHGDRFYVLIGCRTLSKGEAAVKQLHDQGYAGCEVVEITVTDDKSIAKAAQKVEHKFGRVDVLHVNAGIALDKAKGFPEEPFAETIRQTMNTNVAGAAQTVEEFIPLLSKADNPRIVFMSSGLGSLAMHAREGSNNKWPSYSASKAALNTIMLYYRHQFPAWKVNACCPGFRATALNNFGSAEPGAKPGKTEDGAINAVRLTLLGKDGETGMYTSRDDQTGEITSISW